MIRSVLAVLLLLCACADISDDAPADIDTLEKTEEALTPADFPDRVLATPSASNGGWTLPSVTFSFTQIVWGIADFRIVGAPLAVNGTRSGGSCQLNGTGYNCNGQLFPCPNLTFNSIQYIRKNGTYFDWWPTGWNAYSVFSYSTNPPVSANAPWIANGAWQFKCNYAPANAYITLQKK